MAIENNTDKVSFYSGYSVDKIVGVWEGSYDKSTTSSRGGGFFSTIYTFPIAHGFTRPVFTQLLWSENGTNWADGGSQIGSNSTIAISDSTNIYIVTSSNSGTQYYKVIAYWIDGYDNTNPLVSEYTSSQSKLYFDSRQNVQKIASEGSTTYDPGTFGSSQTVSIPHSLGYIPNAKAFFEPISGEVWPLVAGGAQNPFNYSASIDEAYLRTYSDRLDVVILRFSNSTRKIWYRIYYDA